MRPVPDIRDYVPRQETFELETQDEEVNIFPIFFKVVFWVIGILAVALIIINIQAILEFLVTLFVIVAMIALGVTAFLNAFR